MRPSPFPHHGPLAPDQVHGRDELVADLVARLTAHRPTVVVAPRRFGKTSLVGRVAAELADTVTIVRIDLYELRSWADLAGRLAAGLAGVTGPRRSALDRIAASLDVNLGVVRASFRRPQRPEPDLTADRLLDVLVQHGSTTPTVVILDEFSSIRRVDGAAGLLRTKLQHHLHEIGLVFAGSEPSTMRLLFEDTDQPFYAQADLLVVPPLDLAGFTAIVDAGFEGRPPDGLAAAIHGFTGGHPQRSMQLADAAWSAVEQGSTSAWAEALEAVRRAAAPGSETRFSATAPADQAVLRLVAAGEPLFGRAAQLLELSRSSAQNSRSRLLANGQIDESDGRYVVVDPLYGDWIAHRLPL
ncbi:MAG TPA: hypothetical protein VK866_08005 [Acidimicrobiales bacterium]|nr:hypothetical protein [Acidimicrobiales bacterium]